MSYQIAVDSRIRAAFTRHFGAAPRGEGLRATEALLAHPGFERGFHIVKDYRELQLPSGHDFHFARYQATVFMQFDEQLAPCKMAWLGEGAVFGLLRQMHSLTVDSRIERQIFTHLTDALVWLELPTDYQPEFGPVMGDDLSSQ